MDEVVLMLKVLWLSPPVPTMSHCRAACQSATGTGGVKQTYETAQVAPLGAAFAGDDITQRDHLDLGGGAAHGRRGGGQHVGATVPAGEVQTCEQRAGLDGAQLVGEDEGDGISDLLGRDILLGGVGPHALEQRADVDDGRLRLGRKGGRLGGHVCCVYFVRARSIGVSFRTSRCRARAA